MLRSTSIFAYLIVIFSKGKYVSSEMLYFSSTYSLLSPDWLLMASYSEEFQWSYSGFV